MFLAFENRCEHLKVPQKHRRNIWNRSLVSYDDSHAVVSTNRVVPGNVVEPETIHKTGLEEINGDLLAEDFYGVIVTKVLRFFAFGPGRILELVERDFRSAPPPSFGSLPKAVGLTGQAPWLIYSSPQLAGRACSFFANAAALDGRSPKRRSVVALILLTVHFIGAASATRRSI
jgi:hypothetical protein